MGSLREKIGFLKGLAEGLKLDQESKEGKLYAALIDVIDEMVVAINELEDYVEVINQDLCDVEDELYDEDEEYEDFDEDEDEEYCDECSECDYVEVACSKCHEILHIDSCMLENDAVTELACPNCGEILYVSEEKKI